MEPWQIEALIQYNAEQDAMKEYYESLPKDHGWVCGCVECN